MNTVFKFYLQVWDMLSLAAGAAAAWLLMDAVHWRRPIRRAWKAGLGFLVFAAALYPLLAAPAKMQDRMDPDAPIGLDGMAFMAFAERYELHNEFGLEQDYQAVQWLQENVEGTPVIVEANVPEYRWGTRFTIYTGLPGVLGWPNHQRQQRVTGPPGAVEARLADINDFYLTVSETEALEFLEKYHVSYVVLGRLERAYYESVQPCSALEDGVSLRCDMRGYPLGMTQPAVSADECESIDPAGGDELRCPTFGLEKFELLERSGHLRIAYQTGETVIYEVVR
jgi:uncharacterized membrane protein